LHHRATLGHLASAFISVAPNSIVRSVTTRKIYDD